MATNLLTERNIAEATKRIAQAYELAKPNRFRALNRLERFCGPELYRKAHDRYTSQQWFAGGPYKCEKAKAYPTGKSDKEHLDRYHY
jgi:hypothetical protein